MRRAKKPHQYPDWVLKPPTVPEEIVLVLEAEGEKITEATPEGEVLRDLLKQVKSFHQDALQKARILYPIAFFKPSYEQALMLNCWIWGINFPICFSANRIGKTVCFVINAILWLFPNNPSWIMFKPYIDKWGRLVAVLPRPPLNSILGLQEFLLDNPHLVGDFYKQPYEQPNLPLYQTLKNQFATLQMLNPYPNPPTTKSGQIWLGAPDKEFHRATIMKRWKDWLPLQSIGKWNTTECFFDITVQSAQSNKEERTKTQFDISCKSYESEDTKWSGDAVLAIILTEGFSASILSEVKQRVINNGFMSWDYTPAEPRNTGKKVALAHKVYKRQEELPLRNFVFIKMSVAKTPEHIIPREKREDLIRMWEGTDEGKARIDGDFYASSGLVLDKLDKQFHCLNWTLEELYARFPNGRRFRSVDPGLDHPTACAWGYLSYNNIWFIYRFYSQRGKTISQRCKDIIRLSNNERQRFVSSNGVVFWREIHHSDNSEVYVATIIDYHVFKEDEEYAQNFAQKYINEGLIVTESVHLGPEDRAVYTNNLLDPQGHPFLAHPRTQIPPGAKVFFLTSQPGVAEAVEMMNELFWERYQSGDNKGEPKDKTPVHGDDELDALTGLTCSPYIWTSYEPQRRERDESEPELIILPTKRENKYAANAEVTVGFH